jgi:uroporphyrinogen-III decarboxylase
MLRRRLIDLALGPAAFPIGTDLLLHEHADPAEIPLDPARRAEVMHQAARAFRSPLAFPPMDLTVEKSALLNLLDVPPERADAWHFDEAPNDATRHRFEVALARPLAPRIQAQVDAIARIASSAPADGAIIPIGMCIGPFSLASKLLADPITPIFIAGTGVSAAEDEEVRRLEAVLDLSVLMVLRSVEAQVAAGAAGVFIAEPAANIAFFSPNQLTGDGDVFNRYVMQPNRRVAKRLHRAGAELIFHCCGELVDEMVRRCATLEPAMLSLGSSRKLWEDARLVPKTTVLYGNIPSKRFYSDEAITTGQVVEQSRQLLRAMREAGHPFILGSECDVLSVPGCHDIIRRKVDAMIGCVGGARGVGGGKPSHREGVTA